MSTSIAIKGQSAEAQYADNSRYIASQHFQKSATFGRQSAYDELFQVWTECKKANWDGNEALPVLRRTYDNTFRFLQSLPFGCELPSIGVEPDGELTLEWYRNSKWVLSVSIGSTGILNYAALFGHSNSRGSAEFLNDVPDILMTLIKKVMLHARS
ncbi:MAG: hypothetical protein AAGL08_08715 [Cyanobacteria bacterium J06573_11]